MRWNYATDSWKAINQWIYICNLPIKSNYIMVSTPTMHSDKDMKTLLLQVSWDRLVGIVTLWLELFRVIPTLWVSIAKGESLRYIPAHIIMVMLWDGSQWLLFRMPFLVLAPCLAPTASTRKHYWQSWDEYHISHNCYTKFICLLQRVLLNWSTMAPGLVIWTYIRRHSAGWMRQANVCFCYRQICNIPSQNQPHPSM